MKSALAVATAVSICLATLIVLRPWVGGAIKNANLFRNSASEVTGASEKTALEVSGRKPARKRNSRTAALETVPLPDKQDMAPMPERREATEKATPAEAKAPSMPEPQGRLPKAAGDAALAPLLAYNPTDADIASLKDVINHTGNGDFPDAKAALLKISDPAVKKFALWFSYRAEAPDWAAEEITAFLDENPLWPARDKLEESIEDALFWRETDTRKVLAHFQERHPASGAGKAALGAALIATGRQKDGEELVREAWRRHVLTPAMEKKLRADNETVLRSEDHLARANFLLVQDDKSRVGAVNRILPLIDKDKHPSIKARIASVERSKRAASLFEKLDSRTKLEPAVMLARIQWMRRADKDKQAWSLLRSAPKSAATQTEAKQWWIERDAQVRKALNDGSPKTAYAIAKDYGGEMDDEDLSDAEFLAGWIALRFLDQPEAARAHLLTSASAGGLPKRRARASYWLGRTELALHNDAAAAARFADAAQHGHTFYGQLARQMITAADPTVALRTFVTPTQQEIDGFAKLDVMKALIIVQKAKLDELMPVFLFDLARNLDSAPDVILLCELALRIAPRHQALRMAKIAMNRSFPVEHYAYPGALPEFKTLGEEKDVEAALVHALTRQESEFNPKTVSGAGAVGLMQLLPSTAKEIARAFDVKFEKDKLISDPAYNVSLGTAFLYQLIRSYDGSYIMALAGYNAGPGRVRQWVRQFGDPRDKEVDPIDWIERIPFTETRDYVHKIMESAQVYRSRLDGDPAKLKLAEDLHRGRKDKPTFMLGAAAASN